MSYVSVRRYEGIADIDEVVRRAEEGFVPIVSSMPGFIAYRLVDAGGGVGMTISVFESQAQADESNRKAATWLKENLAGLVPNPPQITAGEVRISQQK